MFRLDSARSVRFCDGLTRRDFRHAGSLSAMGLSLGWPGLPTLQARADTAPARNVTLNIV